MGYIELSCLDQFSCFYFFPSLTVGTVDLIEQLGQGEAEDRRYLLGRRINMISYGDVGTTPGDEMTAWNARGD